MRFRMRQRARPYDCGGILQSHAIPLTLFPVGVLMSCTVVACHGLLAFGVVMLEYFIWAVACRDRTIHNRSSKHRHDIGLRNNHYG